METSSIVLPHFTKIISGRILWNDVKFGDLIPYRTFSTKTILARVYNFEITIFTVVKNPNGDFTGPYGAGQFISNSAAFTFETGKDGNNNFAAFTIAGIPPGAESVFVKVSPVGRILPDSHRCDSVTFSSNEAPTFEPGLLLNTKEIVSHIDIQFGCINVN
jgi:hypothetical protein